MQSSNLHLHSSLHAQGASPEGSPVSAADCDMLGPCCSSTVSPSLMPSWYPPPSSGASAGRVAALQQHQMLLSTTCGSLRGYSAGAHRQHHRAVWQDPCLTVAMLGCVSIQHWLSSKFFR